VPNYYAHNFWIFFRTDGGGDRDRDKDRDRDRDRDLLSVDAPGQYSASLTNASTSNASMWRQNLESKRTIKVSYYLSLLPLCHSCPHKSPFSTSTFKKINVEDYSRNGLIGLDRKGACLIAPHQTSKYLM
jgi:hypothetical protein